MSQPFPFQRMFACCLALGLACGATARDITLAWDASRETNVVGYVVAMGTNDGGPYPQRWSVPGRSTANLLVPALAPGRHFFVAQAVGSSNVASDFSNQLQVSIPEPPRLTVIEPPGLLLTGVVFRATNVLGPWMEFVRLPPVAVPVEGDAGYFKLGLEWGRINGKVNP